MADTLAQDLVVMKDALDARRAEDAIWQWEATEKQKPFIESVLHFKKPENWFVAANRSGKSDAGAYIGSCLARFGKDPKWNYSGTIPVKDRATSGWVVSLDFPSSRDIIQPKYFNNGFGAAGSHAPFIPDREVAEWRVSDQILKLKNGSILGYKSADSGPKKFQGADKDWIQFDEEPPKNIYEESVIRVGAGRKLMVFATCTLLPPEGVVGGVTWSYTEIIEKWKAGNMPHVACFGASIYDNPYLDREEIRRLESIYPEGSTQRRIRLDGEWLPGLSGARAYPAFDRRLHVQNQPPPVQRRPLVWCLDFNVEPMVSLVGQRDGRIFRIFKNLVMDEGNNIDMAQMFVEAFPQHLGEIWIYGDATGKHRNAQTGRSDYQLLLNALRTYGSPIRLKVPDTNPLVPDRINAMNHAFRDEHGESLVTIDPSCAELISDLEGVLRDGRGGIKKTFNRNDPYYRRTHTSDAMGYWVVYEEPVRGAPTGLGKMVRRILSPGYSFGG